MILTEKQCRAICRALGVDPDRLAAFTRYSDRAEEGDGAYTVKNWMEVRLTAEEASDG